MGTSVDDFAGKVAFVTGAASGIGQATALAFARAGATVVVADISAEAGQDTVRLIDKTGGHALAVRCDVTRGHEVEPRWIAPPKPSAGWMWPSTTPGSNNR
jgi:NAD(P)-dependent dehydrogenase (short-subunit alcohol dehydrogenase family)